MAQGRNWKENKYIPMERLYNCPQSPGVPTWGNPSKQATYRCTKCGQEHK